MRNNTLRIAERNIGVDYPPFVIVEIGINHEGSMEKAMRMVDDAYRAGAECVKFQSHVVEDEMAPVAKTIVPGHTTESIWDIMVRCAFSEEQEQALKQYVEEKGMIYLCTPFSRAAANRLQRMGVLAFKIGSGECNNYPLVEHIASFRKPMLLSTGMNNIESVRPSVEIMRKYEIPYALFHCTSMYPTPYDKVRLGAIANLRTAFPDAVIGLSDHSMGIYTCIAATALGTSVLEKHFTSDKSWNGPDIGISITPTELKELIIGSAAVHQALGGQKKILPDEQDVINFAYACVVTIKHVGAGEEFTMGNTWVKRPGTGAIRAKDLRRVLGKKAARDISVGTQLDWSCIVPDHPQ